MKEHTPVDTGAWLRGDYQTLFHGISGRWNASQAVQFCLHKPIVNKTAYLLSLVCITLCLSKKVKFALEEAMKAQTGSRGIALLFNLGARWGWVVNAMPRPR
jgi:hypothetical protein